MINHRALKVSLAITGCALIASLITIIVLLRGPRRQEVTNGSILKGMSIEGMRIYRLDSSADALARLDSRPRCMRYPIAESCQIPNPEVGGYIWTKFLAGLSNKAECLPNDWRVYSHFKPDWAMEIDNGESVATMLIDSDQSLVVSMFPTAGTFVHRIAAFPRDEFATVLALNYHEIPNYNTNPPSTKAERATFSYGSVDASPSWMSESPSIKPPEREQVMSPNGP